MVQTLINRWLNFRQRLHIGQALVFVWRSGPRWAIASSALTLVQSLLPLITLYLIKLMFDAVTRGIAAADPDVAFRDVALYIGLAALVTLIERVIGMLASLVSEHQGQIVTDYMADLIHARAIEIDLEYYERPDYFDTLERASQVSGSRPTQIVNSLLQVARNSVSLLGIAALLVSFHWATALILVLATTPGLIVRLRYAGILYRWQRERTRREREASYYNWLLTSAPYAKDIRLFGLGELFRLRFNTVRRQLRQERMAINTQRSIHELIVNLSSTVAIFGSYAFVAYRAVHGDFTVGDLVMYYQAFQRGQSLLQGLLGGLAQLYENNLYLTHVHELFTLQPKVAEPANPTPIPRPIQHGIVFDGVSFHYPDMDHDALHDIHLTIEPGQIVALVGRNGSGKTTLIKLLCRLYDPQQGCITVDGVDLRDLATVDLRRELSVMLQDYVVYFMTARDNIWLGNITLSPDDPALKTAAQKAGVEDVILRLSQGYDTMLGRLFEGGEELSIGEWQKVALARSFLRDAQFIIMDEPTSSLDALAEHEIFENVREHMAGRTAIVISHRLSTVRMADHIYVLDQGRIVEHGTHDELIRLDGTYAQLFETQAQYYR
jgi:ATP-binding cassette subfamily B protein